MVNQARRDEVRSPGETRLDVSDKSAQMIRQLADRAARLNDPEVNVLLAQAVCHRGTDQIRCLMQVTRLMKARTSARTGSQPVRPPSHPA